MGPNDKKNNIIFLVGLSLIVLVFVFTFFNSEFFKQKLAADDSKKTELNYPKIKIQDLKSKLKSNEDIQIIDTRSVDDYEMAHIVNSINFTSEDLISNIPKGKTIVIAGYTADKDENYSKVVDYLKSKKYNNFFILTGGIESWINAGGEDVISIGNPLSFIDNSKVKFINPEDLKKIVDGEKYQKTIIDVRDKQSFDNGHIKGAINIFLNDLEKSKDQISPSKQIFVYGEGEVPGFQAAVRLYDLHFMAIEALKGGLASWKEKNLPLEK